MNEHYLNIPFEEGRPLQQQIQERLVDAILGGHLPVAEPLPSSRKLAEQLKVSRNTIVLVYERMVDAGYLQSSKRRGYFISPAFHDPDQINVQEISSRDGDSQKWSDRFKLQPSKYQTIVKPNQWQQYEYPFIYGQIQQEYFPIEHWRECARRTLSTTGLTDWLHDRVDIDDPMLVEQLRTRILPKRGIYAGPGEILVTMGTQNSLYLLANLLFDRHTRVALENPGYREAHSIFRSFNADLVLQPLDQEGIMVDEKLRTCDYIYITPGHQVPTGVEMSRRRRAELVELARSSNTILIEDDYDAEISMQENPIPAMKADDRDNRIIYLGSLSKSMSPGLRIGFMVADEQLIAEARVLRRLMYRHPASNNQRQTALFLSLGYYDAYLRKLRTLYVNKLVRMERALNQHLPDLMTHDVHSGASSFWLRVADGIDTEHLAWVASREGVLIEPGAVHFLHPSPPCNYLRLGFSTIPGHKIEPGIAQLKTVLERFNDS
ncbi:PLP-dependent aminotransferase family protein [Marinobacter flavimaris]|uniref:MocR-like pyridoxine biosynthesis transcription factor PdxR n=1 Tax=Marinobacter flavimaris TaxID=262076 RepID=UPI00386A14B7|tara:strand:- start:3282 stop:4757 length:1476 start_codon:yes stop_codon:yes gene_type:complete